jgi:hypothetical protein
MTSQPGLAVPCPIRAQISPRLRTTDSQTVRHGRHENRLGPVSARAWLLRSFGAAGTPMLRRAEPDDETGRSLEIVEALGGGWGLGNRSWLAR